MNRLTWRARLRASRLVLGSRPRCGADRAAPSTERPGPGGSLVGSPSHSQRFPTFTRIFIVGLLAVALLPSCGRKTPPKAPELVRPEAIDNLAAKQAETGVLLTWRRPQDYVDGTRMPDLGRFIVERADADGVFRPIRTLEVTDRERFRKNRHLKYTDTMATLGGHYRYRVLSATLDDYVSEPSNVAEITTVSP